MDHYVNQIIKESGKEKPMAPDRKKREVVEGGVMAFSCLDGCSRNLYLTW